MSKTKRAKARTPRICLLVLGMHRSGTSVLSRVLHLLGGELPKTLMVETGDNPTGYFESLPISKLNDQILSSAGSEWADWLPVNAGWFKSPVATEFIEEASTLLESEFEKRIFFVLKDPRICRLAPFWLEVLGQMDIKPACILPFRHPLEVARSLNKRDGMEPDYAALLWLRHVLEAERDSRGTSRVFVSYADVLDNPFAAIERAQNVLGITWPRYSPRVRDEIEQAIERKLHRNVVPEERVDSDPTVAEWVRETYRVLKTWAREGEEDEGKAVLDQISAEMAAASSVFGRLLARGRSVEIDRRKLSSALKAKTEEGRAVEGRLKDAEASVAHASEKIKQVETQAEQRLAQERAEKQRRIDELQASVEQASAKIKQVETQAEQRLAQERTEKQRRIDELQASVEQASATIKQVESEASQSREALSRAQAAALEKQRLLESLEREFAGKQAEYEAHSTELNEQLASAKEAADAARADVANKQAEYEAHSTELNEQLASAKEAADAARADVAKRISELEAATAREQALSAEKLEAESEREALAARVHQLEGEVGQLVDIRDNLSGALAAAKAERDALDLKAQEDLAAAERLADAARAQAHSIAAERDTALSEVAGLKDSLQQAEAKARAIWDGLAVQTAEAAAARGELETIRSERDAALSEVGGLKDQVRAAGVKANALWDGLAKQTAAVDAVGRDLQDARRQLEAALQEKERSNARLLNAEKSLKEERLARSTLERDVETLRADRDARLREMAALRSNVAALQDDLAASRRGEDERRTELLRAAELADAANFNLHGLEASVRRERAARDRLIAYQMQRDRSIVYRGVSFTRRAFARAFGRLDPYELERRRQALVGCVLFDASWYLEMHPDVHDTGADPLDHYLLSGDREGRDPHPLFRRAAYIARVEAQINPSRMTALELYLSDPQGHSPHPLFDATQYSDASGAPCQGALVDYLSRGSAAGIAPNALFDPHWYLRTYVDVARSGLEPLTHYATIGEAEGRRPSLQFDPRAYLAAYNDVRSAGIGALEHYLTTGQAEGRRAGVAG